MGFGKIRTYRNWEVGVWHRSDHLGHIVPVRGWRKGLRRFLMMYITGRKRVEVLKKNPDSFLAV